MVGVKSESDCGFPFEDNSSYRATGIDLRLWLDYLEVESVSGLKVIIYFVNFNQGEIRAASLTELFNHRRKWENPNSGMVYWTYDDLKIMTSIDENNNIIGTE